MKAEDKDLLLKDLSARLPYSVIVRHADALVEMIIKLNKENLL